MNDQLTEIERTIIISILDQHPSVRPQLIDQLDRLSVESREPTGVGLYVNFSSVAVSDPTLNTDLGLSEEIEIPGVPHGAGCVLNVTDGAIHYLEFFTYQEPWDGNLAQIRIVPSPKE